MNNSKIFHQMHSYKNIFSIKNNISSQIHSLYKYINVQHAIEFLKTGKLYLSEPFLWSDPYESRFYNADYKNIENFIPQRLFCTCFTQRLSNEAAWKMYGRDYTGIASRTIRFKFCRSLLLKALDNQVNQKGKVYIGNVLYDYTSKQIQGLHLQNNNLYNKFFGNFSLEKFIYLLLLKRKAFAYEEEVRLFFVPKKKERISFNKKIPDDQKFIFQFSKEVLTKIIESIYIDPQCSSLEVSMIKETIKKLLPDCRCYQHGLYKKKNSKIIIGK